jgi:hypothetical protein
MLTAIQDLTDKIAGRKVERETTAARSFDELALSLADGANPNVEIVERILEQSKRTPNDLRQAVALIVERRELAALLSNPPDLARQAADAEAIFRKAVAAHEKAQADFEAARNANGRATQLIAEQRERLGKARARLLATSPDAEAVTVFETATAEHGRITRELAAARTQLGPGAYGGQGVIGGIVQLKQTIADADSAAKQLNGVEWELSLRRREDKRAELVSTIERLETELQAVAATLADAERAVLQAK